MKFSIKYAIGRHPDVKTRRNIQNKQKWPKTIFFSILVTFEAMVGQLNYVEMNSDFGSKLIE